MPYKPRSKGKVQQQGGINTYGYGWVKIPGAEDPLTPKGKEKLVTRTEADNDRLQRAYEEIDAMSDPDVLAAARGTYWERLGGAEE